MQAHSKYNLIGTREEIEVKEYRRITQALRHAVSLEPDRDTARADRRGIACGGVDRNHRAAESCLRISAGKTAESR